MEIIDCNLCGSGHSRFLYKKADEHFFPDDYFSVVECLDCGLGYVNPRPKTEEMKKYYPNEFYSLLQKREESDRNRFLAQSQYLALRLSGGRQHRLLDIGSANGGFLEFMHDLDWEVEGVEPFASLPSHRPFKIYRCQFPDVPVNEPSYDAVTAWAVLEHVHDPKAYFEKASRVIVSGGVFVFMVPNFSSLISRRLFGEDVPRHLYFFTEENIRRYSQEAGFAVEEVDYKNPIFSWNPNRWLHYLIARVLGRPFTWPINRSYSDFLKANQLKRGIASALGFAFRHPVSFADSAMAPLLGRIERMLGRYGIVVYVARKR